MFVFQPKNLVLFVEHSSHWEESILERAWLRFFWNLPLSPSMMMISSLLVYLCSDWLLFYSTLIITSTKNVLVWFVQFLFWMIHWGINKSRNCVQSVNFLWAVSQCMVIIESVSCLLAIIQHCVGLNSLQFLQVDFRLIFYGWVLWLAVYTFSYP